MELISTDSEDAMDEFTELTDEELTAMALAADPNTPLSPDAVPWSPIQTQSMPLPPWYMPAAVAYRSSTRARVVVAALILGFLTIDAFGLCVTSGFITIA